MIEHEVKLVNIGCGETFHPLWINIDKYSFSPQVLSYDVEKRLPFEDSSVHAVYSSHLIEHLPLDRAKSLCYEAFRILLPAGVFRIVTPDLETIAQTYLEKLHNAVALNALSSDEYDWMILELFDQAVRDRRGGEMAEFLRNSVPSVREFIRHRIGRNAEEYWSDEIVNPTFWKKLRSVGLKLAFKHARYILAKSLVRVIAGDSAAKAFETGMFRHSGEVHYRLYDRYSMGKLLSTTGFTDIRVCRADESEIPDFNSYGLDIIAGEVRKPDSLFMEARKP